jgi:hypothetical protein
MMYKRKLATLYAVCSGFALVCLLFLASSLHAQVRSGTITGTVTDSSGAVVADAQVTVVDTDTNESYSTKTTSAGTYTVPYLATGNYSVTIVKAGFEKNTEAGLHLDPSQIGKADATLMVGSAATNIEVSASRLQLQTESNMVSGVVSAEVIDSIPNLTENPLYYVGLQNGVTARNQTADTQTQNSFGVGVAGRANDSAYGVNGGRAFENDIMLDGLPIMGQGFNEATILPNLEGIQEVQTITNNFSAEYGHGASALSISTKSGTNAFHGSVSYENRNEALNANTYSNKSLTLPRPAFKVNDIGGGVSGPVRRDHLFFASSFHWQSHNSGGESLANVPTDLERVGDFGASLIQGSDSLPAPVQIFDPFNGVTEINSNLYQRQEFPKSPTNSTNYGTGDMIPNPNAVGLAILKLYPEPNRPPTDVYNDNNFGTNLISTFRTERMNNRIDWKRGRHSIYGTGGFDFGSVNVPQTFGSFAVAGFNDAPTTTQDRNPYAQIGDTVVISPTFFIDARYGATRTDTINFAGNHSGFTNYNGFGIAPATQALFAVAGAAPVVNPGTWSALSGGQFTNKQEHQISHAVNGSMTKIHGDWTFKAGSEYRVALANYTDFEEASTNLGGCCANDQGMNTYTAQYVNAGGATTVQDNINQISGYSGAMTLVGEGVWFVRPGANLKPAYASKYFGLWSQNDWKVKPNLTLNLGLRWDVQPGVTERSNRLAGYDLTKMNPFGYLGVIDFPGTNGYSRNLWDTEWHDWQPRIGFAWQVRPTTVLRGGYGITYLPSNSGYFSSPNDYGEASFASGNTGAQTYGPSPHGIPTEMITDAAPLVAATGANAAAPQTYGVGEAYFDRHLKNQVARQANVFGEQTFGGKSQWLLSMGWSGAFSQHLSTRDLNFENVQSVPASTLAQWRATYIASNGQQNPQTQQITNPYQPAGGPLLPFQGLLSGATIQQYLTDMPYPLLFGGDLNGSTGFAKYNSLQVRLAHSTRLLHLEVNYTWSKTLSFVTTAIDDGQGVEPSGTISNIDLYHNRLNQNYDSSDQPHSLKMIAVYQSPFGKEGPLSISNRYGRAILGGWSLSGDFTMSDGFPVFLSGANSGAITGRMLRTPGQALVLPKSYQHWYNGNQPVTLPCGVTVTPANFNKLKYNACAFHGLTVTTPSGRIVPDMYWYGTASETNGDIRGPGRTNIDTTLRRSFSITERYKLEIEGAASNLANHAEFESVWNGGLNGTTTKAGPGQVVGFSGGGYGTVGQGTYDPRQIEMRARIVF